MTVGLLLTCTVIYKMSRLLSGCKQRKKSNANIDSSNCYARAKHGFDEAVNTLLACQITHDQLQWVISIFIIV